MTTIAEAVRATLVADAAVAAILVDRVYPMERPRGTSLPAIVYQQLTRQTERTYDVPASLNRADLSLDLVTRAFEDLQGLGAAVAAVMDGISRTTNGTLTMQAAFLDDERDLYEPAIDAAEPGIYRRIMDFRIFYQ